MNLRTMRFLVLWLALGLLAAAGCASRPVLISKSAAVPVGINLTGSWRVRADPNAARIADSPALHDRLILAGKGSRPQKERSGSGGSVQVFLEFGDTLKITQTQFGLFISYDRSVVEEYTFGENRLVTVGPIEAMRVSGWEGDAFAVETLDDSGSVLTETWQLENDANVLVRDVQINKGEREMFRRSQVFDRE